MTSSLAEQLAFEPIGLDNRPAAITRRIRQAISVGLLSEGVALPSEFDLAAQLGVSTISLRAALAQLRAAGFIETRRGRGGGSYVQLPPTETPSSPQALLSPYDLEELRDFRDYHTALSGATAALAARRARGPVVDRLFRLGQALTDATDAFSRARADSRFHIEVAAATRSVRLARAEVAVQAEIGGLLWAPGLFDESPRAAGREHQLIVTAIADADADAARGVAQSHVRWAMDHLIQLRMDLGENS